MIERLTHLWAHRWVDRHFDGELPPNREGAMRRHLARCPHCRAHYNLRLCAEAQGPHAAGRRRDRMERALFGSLDSEQPRADATRHKTAVFPLETPWARALALGAVAATAATLVVVVKDLGGGGRDPDDSLPPVAPSEGFAGPSHRPTVPTLPEKVSRRGHKAGEGRVTLAVFGKTGKGKQLKNGDSVGRGDGLAFRYANLSGGQYTHLMLFAIDGQYKVRWYYPAWADPAKNPTAYPIRQGLGKDNGGILLPQTVVHPDLAGDAVRIVALFTDRADLTVKEVERRLAPYIRQRTPLTDTEPLPLGPGEQTGMVVRLR